jgi:hypothetical protein
MCRRGEEVSKSKKLAKEFFGKACDFDSAIGPAEYANMK